MARDFGVEQPAPGVHVRDVRPCDACGEPLAKRPDAPVGLTAYRLRLDTLLLDVMALRTFSGVAVTLGGNEALAAAFTPYPEIYRCATRDELLVCFDCYALQSLAAIAERACSRREAAAQQADGYREPEPEKVETA